MKQKIRILLAVLLCVGLLAGCGSSGGSLTAVPSAPTGQTQQQPEQEQPEETGGPDVYQAQYRTLAENSLTAALQNGTVLGDRLYFTSLGVTADETPEGVTPDWPEQYWVYGPVLCRLGLDGSLERIPYVPTPTETEGTGSSGVLFEKLCAGSDDTLWLLENHYRTWNEAPEGMGEADPTYADYARAEEHYVLVRVRTDGTLVSAFPLDTLRGHPEAVSSADGSYSFAINGIAQDGEGHVGLAVRESFYSNTSSTRELSLFLLDGQTGALVAQIPMDSTPELLTARADGRLAALYYEGGTERVAALDPATRSFVDAFPVDGYPDSLLCGGDGFLYYSEGNGFFRLDEENGTSEKLFNWIDCDVARGSGESICVLSDGSIVTTVSESSGETTHSDLVVLTRTGAGQSAEKKVLRLAVLNLYPWTSRMVSRFNRTNPDYRIEVTDYAQFNDYTSADQADWNAGVTRLQTDIITGNTPDILDISLLSVDRLGAKGILVDLYPYLDADPELGRDSLLSSVLAAYEENGRLYQTVGNFYILTTVGLRDHVGETMGWTMEQFRAALQQFRAENPGGAVFQNYMTRSDILNFLLYLEMENYVDWNAGECRFDSPAFIQMLEFLKGFPDSFDWTAADLDLDEDGRMLHGLQLLKQCNFSSFTDLQTNTAGLGGAPCTFIGYPTEHGVGSMFAGLGNSFAISSSCTDKDAAWQFVRQFFLPDYQELFQGAAFPTNRAVYEEMKHKAMTAQYQRNPDGSFVLNADGERMEADLGSLKLGGGIYRYHPATEEEVALTEEIIFSTTHVLRLDDSLKEIITSGAAAYFADQKSAEETARLIQSRASLYVNEQR